jgi:hypothetical protein
MSYVRGLVVFLLLSGLGFILVGCQAGEELEFETIELTDQAFHSNDIYWGEYPHLVIIIETDDITEIEKTITKRTLDELYKIDFDKYVVLAVFRGLQGSNLFYVEVQQIIRWQEDIFIYVNFIDPPPDIEVQGELASPYHIIKIPKDDLNGEYTLKLEGTILTTKVDIP